MQPRRGGAGAHLTKPCSAFATQSIVGSAVAAAPAAPAALAESVVPAAPETAASPAAVAPPAPAPASATAESVPAAAAAAPPDCPAAAPPASPARHRVLFECTGVCVKSTALPSGQSHAPTEASRASSSSRCARFCAARATQRLMRLRSSLWGRLGPKRVVSPAAAQEPRCDGHEGGEVMREVMRSRGH